MFDISHMPPSSWGVLGGAALLGGLVRGFTGFGFAMAFVPLATVVTSPMVAVGLIFAMDAPFALPLAARSVRKASWREILPLLLGATLCFPAGLFLLMRLDPTATRWIVAVLILLAVSGLASGWRYVAPPSVPHSLGAGALSGLANGLAGLGGMPLALFWLAGQHNDAAQTRHNLLTFFAASTIVSWAVLTWTGVLNWAVIRDAALLLGPYGLGLLIGTRGFQLASETTFRRAAYGVIACAAILAMPVLDGWLR